MNAWKSEIAALAALPLEDLRMAWKARFGQAPKLRARELLAMMLAYRIQAEREGGVETDTRRSMRRPAASPGMTALRPGTRLSREWKGVRYDVIVEADGRLQWQDGHHGSLSEVARAITGTRWNGPRFFGLREGAAS